MFNGCCDVIRYGRRSLAKRRREQDQEAESAAQLFPLLDHHDDNDDPECTRKMKPREFRLASRCQVITHIIYNIVKAYSFIYILGSYNPYHNHYFSLIIVCKIPGGNRGLPFPHETILISQVHI